MEYVRKDWSNSVKTLNAISKPAGTFDEFNAHVLLIHS